MSIMNAPLIADNTQDEVILTAALCQTGCMPTAAQAVHAYQGVTRSSYAL